MDNADRRRNRGESFFLAQPLVLIFILCSVSLFFTHVHNEASLEARRDSFEEVLRQSRTSMSKKMMDHAVIEGTNGDAQQQVAPRRNASKAIPIALESLFDRQKHQAAFKNNLSMMEELHKQIQSVASNEKKDVTKIDASPANDVTSIRNDMGNVSDKIEKEADANVADDSKSTDYQLAGLNCDAHRGPSAEIAKEMVYWEDIPSDNRFVSMYKKEGVTQYLTFEADDAGWNNQRMAVETVVALAATTGRTLVVPPAQYIWNLNKEGAGQQQTSFAFSDFFPFTFVSKEHAGLKIISTKEFLEKEGLSGNLRDKNGTVSFPPGNRTDWDGANQVELNMWIREISVAPYWNPDKCMLVFPASKDPKDLQDLLDIKTKVEKAGGFPKYETYIGKPNPLNASAEHRMKENWAEYWTGGKKLCTYTKELENSQVLHFPYDFQREARLLTHFYAFLFFQDWRLDLWLKRLVRDHLRYVDPLQCVAARIIKRIRDRARARGDPDGNFEGFHIRREDFAEQFKHTIVDANRIYEVSREVLLKNATIYIASDERNRSFFDDLRKHYDIVFLEDFQEELAGLNTNYYGMVEQLVVSKARSFFGCWQSSFTNYINRIRGYHTNKAKSPGFEDGIIPSWYYTTEEHRNDFQSFAPVYQGYYYREFPTSWRLIDTGVKEMEDLIRPRR